VGCEGESRGLPEVRSREQGERRRKRRSELQRFTSSRGHAQTQRDGGLQQAYELRLRRNRAHGPRPGAGTRHKLNKCQDISNRISSREQSSADELQARRACGRRIRTRGPCKTRRPKSLVCLSLQEQKKKERRKKGGRPARGESRGEKDEREEKKKERPLPCQRERPGAAAA